MVINGKYSILFTINSRPFPYQNYIIIECFQGKYSNCSLFLVNMIQNKKNNIISFFIKYPNLFLGLISTYYSLSQYQLKIYKNILDWNKISANENINWDADILNEFCKFINWDTFTTNPSAFNDQTLLVKFSDKIDWYGNDNYCGDSIAANEGFHWDIKTIDKYADKINFNKLSTATNVDWSELIIDKYIKKWNLTELAHNESIPWSLNLFEKYLDESYFFYYGVQANKSLVSFELVEKYNHLMDWHNISFNPKLPWIEKDLLNYWSDKIVWTGIACNKFLFAYDRNFFQKHYEKWQPIKNKVWSFFSGNEAFPWSKHMIQKFKFDLDWNILCSNEGIIWDMELVNSFSNYVKWGGWKPCELLDKNGNVISPIGGKEYEFGLIDNKSIPWSIDYLQMFEQELEFEALESNTTVWEKAFKPYIDDEMIKTIMRIL